MCNRLAELRSLRPHRHPTERGRLHDRRPLAGEILRPTRRIAGRLDLQVGDVRRPRRVRGAPRPSGRRQRDCRHLYRQSTLLRGVARLPRGQPDAGAIVIAFPSDIAAWADFGPSPRRVRSSWTTATGEYSIAGCRQATTSWSRSLTTRRPTGGMPPVAALARVATPVAIRDGEQKTQDLRTRPSW